MIKYLVKSVVDIRVETEQDANDLHTEYENEAKENNWVLTGWNQSLKTKKSKGEIIESYYLCRATLTFNDPKEPLVPLKSITYDMINGAF